MNRTATYAVRDQMLSTEIWTVEPIVAGSFKVPAGGIPALVPGDVHDDLERAGLLQPHEVGMGDPRWLDVARTGWRYRTILVVPEFDDSRRVWLDFDGVDFTCRVLIDGVTVAEHSGMYRRFTFEITQAVRSGARAVLEVEIDALPEGIDDALRAADGPLSDEGGPNFFVFVNNRIRRALKDLKSPTAGSYDWAVNTWTVGIWRDVRLRITGPSRIEHLRIGTDCTARSAALTCRLELTDSLTHESIVRFVVRDPDGAVVSTTSRLVAAGVDQCTVAMNIPDPALWWPIGYGDQPLYSVTAELATSDGMQVDDSLTHRIGLRRIEWAHVDGAGAGFINPFRLVVNGVTVRTMGSNLVPPDLLYGRIGRHGTWLLHAAASAGFNTLRVWGGGVLLPDALYDLADELGILLLHEFFLANCLPETDEEFLYALDATVRSVIQRVRHHPSIVEWGGGNELLWKQADDHPALQAMRLAALAEDDRIFRATCPMEGSRHSPWHFNHATSYAHYDDPTLTDSLRSAPLMRYGEFGAPSPAHLEVWERDIPAENRWPIDSYEDPVLVRKNVFSAAFGQEFWLMPSLIEELFGLSRSLRDLVRAGQFLGAEGVRYAIDALRRRGRRLGGFTTWDFNEPWPNGAGSYLVDFDGRPMLSFAFARQAMAPVSLSLKLDGILHPAGARVTIPVMVVSDATARAHGLTWAAVVYSMDGTALSKASGGVKVLDPLEVAFAGELSAPLPADGSPVLVHVRLDGASGLVSERVQVLGASGITAPLAPLLPEDRHPAPDEIAEAGVDPGNPFNLAAARNGGRVIRVSGSEARSTDPSHALVDGEFASAADGLTGVGAWRSTTEHGWVEIELARPARVSRICLGRDRSGSEHDRTIDKLAIELSADGTSWAPVARFDRLAAMLGDRLGGSASDLRNTGSPIWTLDVRLPATDARYARIEVAGRQGRRRFVALDEVEVYEDPAVRVNAAEFLVRDHREYPHRLSKTTLSAKATGTATTHAGLESLKIRVHNTGSTIALFCDVAAEAEYRPRVLVEGSGVSIPPDEHRDLTLLIDPALSQPILMTNWKISAWNADAVRIR